MKTHRITQEKINTARPWELPGVTGPGSYTWDERAHTFVPAPPIDSSDITSGLGIGGAGSDDYNINTEGEQPAGYNRGAHAPGDRVCPAGTTYGQRGDDDDTCAVCGTPADWNPNAGRPLCPRHWDEY